MHVCLSRVLLVRVCNKQDNKLNIGEAQFSPAVCCCDDTSRKRALAGGQQHVAQFQLAWLIIRRDVLCTHITCVIVGHSQQVKQIWIGKYAVSTIILAF